MLVEAFGGPFHRTTFSVNGRTGVHLLHQGGASAPYMLAPDTDGKLRLIYDAAAIPDAATEEWPVRIEHDGRTFAAWPANPMGGPVAGPWVVRVDHKAGSLAGVPLDGTATVEDLERAIAAWWCAR